MTHPRAATPPVVDSWTRITFSGDLDSCCAERLRSTLRVVWERELVMVEVDLSGVTAIDRDGLAPLVEARARLRDRLRLFAPSAPVVGLLDTLGLSTMFGMVGPVALAGGLDARSSAPDWAPGWGTDERPVPVARPLTDRATIEQAKGLLMGANRCTAAAAWELLRGAARDHGVPIRVMARMLVEHATGGLSPSSQLEVDDVLADVVRSEVAIGTRQW